jgi:hypothetical protein
MSHPGIHEAFEAERAKQLTEKERTMLVEALYRLSDYEDSSIHGVLHSLGKDASNAEVEALCVKIFGEADPE